MKAAWLALNVAWLILALIGLSDATSVPFFGARLFRPELTGFLILGALGIALLSNLAVAIKARKRDLRSLVFTWAFVFGALGATQALTLAGVVNFGWLRELLQSSVPN